MMELWDDKRLLKLGRSNIVVLGVVAVVWEIEVEDKHSENMFFEMNERDLRTRCERKDAS